MKRDTALKKPLKLYETTLNEIGDGVGETDLDGNLTYINDTGCRMWGYQREELIGTNYRMFMPHEEADFLRDSYRSVLASGKTGRVIHEVLRKDGTRLIVEDTVSIIYGDHGKVCGYRTVQRDVTDREIAHRALKDHGRRLEAIFKNVEDAVAMLDTDGKIIEANASMEVLCGLSIKEIINKNFSALPLRCTHACASVLEITLEEGKQISGERIECGLKGKRPRLVGVNSSPILDDKGKMMGSVLVLRNLGDKTDKTGQTGFDRRFETIVGKSAVMQKIYSLLADLADMDTTVLVTGESGTGKELAARAIHYSGRRAQKPFVSVNCASLSENLLESELFGHVRGAFTGATTDKKGRFEAADGGTILLDEIGDISPTFQVKLLRILEERIVERVGDYKGRKVNLRVIACTNKDLKEKVRKGEFREDLYYRLMVVEVALPPLRRRMDDLEYLVKHFLDVYNKRYNKKIEGVSRDVFHLLNSHSWPGNIRELKHAVEHAFVLCKEPMITTAHLPTSLKEIQTACKIPYVSSHAAGFTMISKKHIDGDVIREVLKQTDGNKAKAARLLGIHRRTLYRKLEKT